MIRDNQAQRQRIRKTGQRQNQSVLPSSLNIHSSHRSGEGLHGTQLNPSHGIKSSNASVFQMEMQNRLDKIYEFPASYQLAQIHKNAFRFGSTRNTKMTKQCVCCDNFVVEHELSICDSPWIEKQQADIKQSSVRFNTIPLGVAMYFNFVKRVIIYLLLRFFIFDCATIYFSIYGNYCSELLMSHSNDLCAMTLSGYNLKNQPIQSDARLLDILNVIFTIVSILYYINFKRTLQNYRNDSQKYDVEVDDFSILIENIPIAIKDDQNKPVIEHQTFQDQLQTWIKDQIQSWICIDEQDIDEKQKEKLQTSSNTYYEFKDPRVQAESFKFLKPRPKIDNKYQYIMQNLTGDEKDQSIFDLIGMQVVTSVTLCYDLTQMETINKLRDVLIEKSINSVKQKQELTHDDVRGIRDEMQMYNKEYIELCKRFSEDSTGSFHLSHFTGKAIVSLQYQHFRDYFINAYEENNNFFNINGTTVSITRANKPTDIYWFNMKVKDQERRQYISYSWGVLIMILILSFTAFMGLQLWQSSKNTNINETNPWQIAKRYLVTASSGLLAAAINFFIDLVIELLAKMEKHKTKSDRLTSLITKNIVAQTINTSFMYFILYLIQPVNPLGTYGLVNKIMSVIIVSGIVTISLELVKPKKIWEAIKRIKTLDNKGADRSKVDANVAYKFQTQLNEQMQHPRFNIAGMYTFYIVFTFVVSFYGFLIPLATPVIIVVFFIQYWVDKFNLYKRSSPIDFGYELGRMMFTLFEVSIVLFNISYTLWDITIHIKYGLDLKLINIFSLVIAIQFVGFELFVPNHIKNKLNDNVDTVVVYSYERYKYNRKFTKTFYSQNPATKFLEENTNYNTNAASKLAMQYGDNKKGPNYRNFI